MARKIRVGVIGTSPFAENMHIIPLESHPQVELTAICGRNRERAEALANKFHIPQVFTDWHDLVDRAGVDALAVIVPDDLHYPITMAALNAGMHVFCEKALAMNQSQAREMYETAEQKGLVHMTMFTFRWVPAFAYMSELIAGGYVGEIHQAQFSYLISHGRSPGYIWRADRRHSNGMLADIGSHLFDLAVLLCGDIQRVACRSHAYAQRSGPDGESFEQVNDSAVCLLEFKSGAQATLQVSSMVHLGVDNQAINLQVFGSEGTLTADYSGVGNKLAGVRGQGGAIQELPIQQLAIPDRYNVSFSESSVGERMFIDSILSGDRPVPSFYEGWKAQQVIDAAIDADRSGCWVAIAGD